ncbi:MAG: hypothetical protein Q8R40_01910 [bacterium]|nr:hypothetical protein [bacterium]
MHFSSAKRLIITSGIYAFVIGALGFGFWFISSNVRDYQNNLGQTVTKISSIEADFQRISKITDLLKTRSADIGRLQQLGVDRKRPLQFIETIEKIGRLTNTKIALSVTDAKSTSDSLFFGATIEGSEQDVRTMLALILSLPYQINMDSLAFQRADTSASRGSVSIPPARLVLTMKVKTQQ